jgi:cytochrome c oxidase assembly protein subunit 11
MSVFNVTPLQAGKYFNKIECFCFEEQKLSPNEEVEMPVSFFIDPEIKNDKFINEISEITLSYTMFIKEE